MNVVFTPEADLQADDLDVWWREHRPKARDLFARELVETLERLAGAPDLGVEYQTRSGIPYRRVLMQKTRTHVYFEVDRARDLIEQAERASACAGGTGPHFAGSRRPFGGRLVDGELEDP